MFRRIVLMATLFLPMFLVLLLLLMFLAFFPPIFIRILEDFSDTLHGSALIGRKQGCGVVEEDPEEGLQVIRNAIVATGILYQAHREVPPGSLLSRRQRVF